MTRETFSPVNSSGSLTIDLIRDRPAHAHTHFEAIKRLLDAEDPSFRD